jgi:hypothetical protein
MVRAILTLTVACLLCSGVAASLPKSSPPSPERASLPAKGPAGANKESRQSGSGGTLVITARTKVLLNGRPCRYEQVPDNAVITFAEVDSDQKTLLRIHFRTGP